MRKTLLSLNKITTPSHLYHSVFLNKIKLLLIIKNNRTEETQISHLHFHYQCLF